MYFSSGKVSVAISIADRGLRIADWSSDFPCADFSGDDAEKWMRLGRLHATDTAISFRGTQPPLCAQMVPFVEQLPSRLGDCIRRAQHRDFRRIEMIAALHRLLRQRSQEGRNRRSGFGVRLKTDELRMMPVALRRPGENLLCEQILAPGGDEAFGVEVLRVQRPESHGEKWFSSADGATLVEREQRASARGADVLIMHFTLRAREAVIEAEFIEHRLEIVHVHLAREVASTSPAVCARAGLADLLVAAHAQRARALEHVEKLSKRNVEQQSEDPQHVDDRPNT